MKIPAPERGLIMLSFDRKSEHGGARNRLQENPRGIAPRRPRGRRGKEDVIQQSLEDDARARGDDSRIRCSPGHAEKCIFPGLFNCATRQTMERQCLSTNAPRFFRSPLAPRSARRGLTAFEAARQNTGQSDTVAATEGGGRSNGTRESRRERDF